MNKKRELLFSIKKNAFEMQTFRCGGNGGQHQNKTSSGVRFIHKESGARGESRDERSQAQNKKKAFKRLTESSTFKVWLQKKIYMRVEKENELQRVIDESMHPKNLRVECRENGKWRFIDYPEINSLLDNL